MSQPSREPSTRMHRSFLPRWEVVVLPGPVDSCKGVQKWRGESLRSEVAVFAQGSSYISLPWWAGQAVFGTCATDAEPAVNARTRDVDTFLLWGQGRVSAADVSLCLLRPVHRSLTPDIMVLTILYR